YFNRKNILAMVSAIIGLITLGLSYSYGGFLAVVVGVITLLVLTLPGSVRRKVIWGIASVVVLVFLIQLPSTRFHEKLNFTTRSSGLVRTQIWRTAIEIGKQHPLFGIGPNTFERAYRKVAPTLYHPPLEWLVAKPHNLYLNLWVETGILGLIGTV